MVYRYLSQREARGLQPGQGLHGREAAGLCDLGEDPGGLRQALQGDGAPELLLPDAHPDELPPEGEGPRRGLQARARGGDPRRRGGARRAALRAADLRDDHLVDVQELDPVLPRPAAFV